MKRYKITIFVILALVGLVLLNPPLGFRTSGLECDGSPSQNRSERLSLADGQWILDDAYATPPADDPLAECGVITTYTQYLR